LPDRTEPLKRAVIATACLLCSIAGVAAPRAIADPAPVYGPPATDRATASAGQPAAPSSPSAGAQSTPAGALSAPGQPQVSRVVCKTSCLGRRKAVPGAVIKVKGEFLDYTQQVVFRGPAGPLPVSLTYRSPILVRAMVPQGAISSRPYVIDTSGRHSNRAPRKLTIKPAPVAVPGTGVFPVQGPHTYGDGFGAPRSGHTHQGQDILAACGTPLLAVANATVQYAGYQASAAGNYIVLDLNGTEDDVVYMHLAYPAMVRTVNAPVVAGQQIGVVGQTGDATGCHLHFEYWRGDWYGGGQPVDPLPYLLALDPTR
jgi:murein DD-endopeptidase MepM/ murein hydrolase activator NlpD